MESLILACVWIPDTFSNHRSGSLTRRRVVQRSNSQIFPNHIICRKRRKGVGEESEIDKSEPSVPGPSHSVTNMMCESYF